MTVFHSPDPSTIAYVNAMVVKPSDARIQAFDTFIRRLKECYAWNNLDALYIFAQEDADASRINVIQPGFLDLVKTNSPEFITDNGWSVSQMIGTLGADIADSNSLKLQRDNWTLLNGFMDSQQASYGTAIFQSTTVFLGINPRNASDQIILRGGTSSNDTIATSISAKGIFAIRRFASPSYLFYQSSGESTGVSRASSPMAVTRIELAGATIGPRLNSFAALGAQCTVQQVRIMQNAYLEYMYTIGQNPL